jgi:transcriptional regulator with XRE-family HTH domain
MARTSRADQVRQVKQITQFLREGPLWASELAGRLGITPRSVNRLLADLRSIGVPLQSERVGFRVRHWIGEIVREDRAPESPQPSPEMESREVLEPAAAETFPLEDDWE